MYVYFVRVSAQPQMLKVGKAREVGKRLAELQIGCPYELQLLGTLQCKSDGHALGVERIAHEVFQKEWVRGEWFRYTGRVQMAVKHILEIGVADRLRESARDAFNEHSRRFRLDKFHRKLRSLESPDSDLDREFRERMQ